MSSLGQFQTPLFKNFTITKSTKRLQANKNKKMLLKNICGENGNLFAYLCFCAFDRVSLCRLMLVVLFVLLVRNLSVKKFKTTLITSIILLLRLEIARSSSLYFSVSCFLLKGKIKYTLLSFTFFIFNVNYLCSVMLKGSTCKSYVL